MYRENIIMAIQTASIHFRNICVVMGTLQNGINMMIDIGIMFRGNDLPTEKYCFFVQMTLLSMLLRIMHK